MEVIDQIGVSSGINVSVILLTYNQKKYVHRTINSIINQVTTFDYEIIIHDDNSIDGTKDIVREYALKYPSKVRGILQTENQYQKGICITNFFKDMVNGKYIALCEGDDYWPTNDKLQKQYQFMETHPDYFAVGGVTRYFDDEGVECSPAMPSDRFVEKEMDELSLRKNQDAIIATNTLMIRSILYKDKDFLNALQMSPMVGDSILIAGIYDNGKLFVMSDVFQHHGVHPKKDADNYNSIFTQKEIVEHSIMVAKAIDLCLRKDHKMTLFLAPRIGNYFLNCMVGASLKDFIEIVNKLPKKYRIKVPWYLFKKVIYLLRLKLKSDKRHKS